MDKDALIALMLRALKRHEDALGLLEALALVSLDNCIIVHRSLERCACTGCDRAASTRHVFLGVRCCTRCAARLMVKAANNITESAAKDQLLPLRVSIMEDECWLDMPNSDQIRRLQDYVDAGTAGNEPEPPDDPELLQ